MALPKINFNEIFANYSPDAKYIIHCKTCEKIFFQSTLTDVQKLINYNPVTGTWDRNKFTPMKQKWYIQAARHWIETDLKHELVLTITEMIDGVLHSNLGFELSKDWHRGLMLEPSSKRDKQAMLNELDYLEKNLI